MNAVDDDHTSLKEDTHKCAQTSPELPQCSAEDGQTALGEKTLPDSGLPPGHLERSPPSRHCQKFPIRMHLGF